MSLLLVLLLASSVGARVTDWESYTHMGNVGDLLLLPSGQVLLGTSGGAVFAGNQDGWSVDSVLSFPGSLSHSFVECLWLDSDGSVWIGTRGGGIDVFHPGGGTTHYGQLDGLPLEQEVNCILVDSVVWAGTTQGLAIKELGYFVTWDTFGTGGGLPSNRVNCVAMADSGLVVGLGSSSGAVMLLSGTDPGDFDSWRSYPETSGIGFTRLCAAADTIWAATDEGLLFLADSIWRQDTGFPGSSALSVRYSAGDLAVGSEGALHVRSGGAWTTHSSSFTGSDLLDLCWVEQDSLIVGRGWQYTQSRAAGPGICSGFGESWSGFEPPGAPSNDLIDAAVDGYGGCWVTSEDYGSGVVEPATGDWTIFRSSLPSLGQQFACGAESQGGVFISCYHYGIGWIDWKGTSSKQDDEILVLDTSTSGILNDEVLDISCEPGATWFSHEPFYSTPNEPSGVSLLEWSPGQPASAQWKTWTAAEGIPSPYVGAVEPDGDGNAWVGTNLGLVLLDGVSGQIWPPDPIDSADGLPSDSITCIAVAPWGDVYVGTSGGLAVLEDGSALGTAIEEVEGSVLCLLVDYLSNVWAGTQGALYQIEPDGDIEVYNTVNSPLLEAAIRGLALDSDLGYLYAATGRGLWRADLGSGLAGSGGEGPTLFPNPFLPSGINGLRLAGLPDLPVTVALFDLSGALVYQSLAQSRDEFIWYGLDDGGDEVPAGTYIARIEQGGEIHLFKLAIIR